jgi:hypothetical protein
MLEESPKANRKVGHGLSNLEGLPAHSQARGEADGSPKGDPTGEQSLQMYGGPEGEQ